MLVPKTKATILSWWASKTHMSLNKKEAARRRLTPKVYEEKSTQYPMETQICFIISILYLMFYFVCK
jgi:hypothetical protein